MLAHRLRRWSNIKPTQFQSLVLYSRLYRLQQCASIFFSGGGACPQTPPLLKNHVSALSALFSSENSPGIKSISVKFATNLQRCLDHATTRASVAKTKRCSECGVGGGRKAEVKHEASVLSYVHIFYPLEVVDRGSETQLQVGKKNKSEY